MEEWSSWNWVHRQFSQFHGSAQLCSENQYQDHLRCCILSRLPSRPADQASSIKQASKQNTSIKTISAAEQVYCSHSNCPNFASFMLISLKLVAARLNFVAALLNLCFVAMGVLVFGSSRNWMHIPFTVGSIWPVLWVCSRLFCKARTSFLNPTTALEMLSRGKENGQIMLLVAVKYNFTLGIGAVARSRKQNNTNGSSFQAYSKPKFPKGTKIILCISQTCSK